MAISVKEITYGAFGRCVEVSNGIVDLVVTVDAGPRIIRYGFTGRENMFAEAPDQVNEETGWKILGGHRLWHSPENMPRTYENDNKPVKWEATEDGILVVQEPEAFAMTQKEMEISMDTESSAVTVLHRIRNVGAWPAEFAVWALSVMAPGGKEVIPMSETDTGLLANRTIALWPYSKMNDHRIWWGSRYITLQQDPATKPPFKLGITNEYGWAAYFNFDQVFVKQHIHEDGEKYPDGGMSFETYTTDFMLEMETLSPLIKVEPGEELEHMECWALVDGIEAPANDDDAIETLMDDIIGDCDCDDGCGCGCGCDECGDGCDCDDECGCDCDDECDCGHDHGHAEDCDCEKDK